MNIQTESLLTKVRNFINSLCNIVLACREFAISKILISLFYMVKISGETASATVNTTSLSDLSNLANASLYGFEDYHGVDIGVVRAVRLWYAPLGVECPLEIKLRDDDTKLGFSISRTEEVTQRRVKSTTYRFVENNNLIEKFLKIPQKNKSVSRLSTPLVLFSNNTTKIEFFLEN